MLHRVRHRLAGDVEGGGFDRRVQPVGATNPHVDRHRCPAGDVVERWSQAGVEQGRPESLRELAKLGERGGDLPDRAVQRGAGVIELLVEQELRVADRQPEGHEPLLRAVVQVALQPTAFGLARGDDPRPRRLDLGELHADLHPQARDLHGEPRGAQDAVQRVGTIEERGIVQQQPELEVAAPDGRAGPPPVLVARRLAQAAVGPGEALGGRKPEQDVEPAVVERPREHHTDLLGLGAAGAHVLEEGVDTAHALVAPPGEATVDDPLRRVARRPKGDGHGERRERGRPRRATPEQDTDEHDDRRVRRRERRRQGHVDQRPVDKPIDLVQPVARDRHGHRRRDREGRAEQEDRADRGVPAEDQELSETDDDRCRQQRRRVREPPQLQPLDPARTPHPPPHRHGHADQHRHEYEERDELERGHPARDVDRGGDHDAADLRRLVQGQQAHGKQHRERPSGGSAPERPAR